eukprot:TRINITY_DN8780_c0_g1_i1.p1 TRINITY_DN8780_c0_g1~~TRINITY_DN8780_c0_g1_i1.p1  ORF type:complete len:150 (-),score=43.56 TRINITY_DN8780_c0_g1_i1:78-527(-)
METLTQEQISEFQEAFKMFSGGNDTMDKNSLRSVMKQLGLKPRNEEIQEMIEDTEAGPSVGFNEFVNMMAEKMNSLDDEDTLIGAFECYDPLGKGTLSHDDFKHLMLEVGGSPKFSDKEVREFIKLCDLGEGILDYNVLIEKIYASVPK